MKQKTAKQQFKEIDEMILKHRIEMDILQAKQENWELEMWKMESELPYEWFRVIPF